jgi:hypothetical protein
VLVLGLALFTAGLPGDSASDLPDSGPLHPLVAGVELLLPGLFAPVPTDTLRYQVRNPWADALGLPGPPDNELVPTHAGFVALLLALVGLVFARGLAGGSGRAALLAGLLLLLLGAAPGAFAAGRVLLLAGVATLAGAQLHALGLRGETEDRGQAALALGGVAVLLAALLAVAAIHTGQASDWVAAQPCMVRFAALAPSGFSDLPARETMAAIALRNSLDHAALAAFAAMTALLVHLKSRSRATAALVLVVAAAELLLPRFLS